VGWISPIADQGPVDAGQPRRRVDALANQFMGQTALSPQGMAPPQFAQVGLDGGRQLVGAMLGPVGAVGQGVQPTGPIPAQPVVDRLAADAVAVGDLDHREPVAQHFHDGVEALLGHGELQEHAPDLLTSPLIGEAEEGRAVMSTINRNSGTHQPVSTAQASTGSAQEGSVAVCQRSARNCATCNRIPPHDPTLNSASHQCGCVGT
jgi:hypothetical protein